MVGEVPVPDSWRVTDGAYGESVATVTVPRRSPASFGANRSCRRQAANAARLAPQSFVPVKFP